MIWTELNFGKHSGLILPQIIFHDPDWFFYAYENDFFKDQYETEARELYRRARSIRIPQVFGRRRLVHYIGRGGKEKFGAMGIVEERDYEGKQGYFDVLDFYVPKTFPRCDKTSYRRFVASVKDELFGNASRRMNREACEVFFNNDYNFDLRRRPMSKANVRKEAA